MPITSICAGLLGLLYFVLTYRVIRLRQTGKIGIGTGGLPTVERAIRVHANLMEYAPLILIMMGLVEAHPGPHPFLMVIGGCLVVGRICHAVGMGSAKEILPLRAAGMILTLGPLLSSAILVLWVTLKP
jgi:uncharacterized membrane protein YecN with MAPEG domain